MQVNISHKTAVLVKLGHILQRKCPLVFPSDVLLLLCLSAVCYFSRAVPKSDPLLQLQLRSAGSLHVAFKNLHESQS